MKQYWFNVGPPSAYLLTNNFCCLSGIPASVAMAINSVLESHLKDFPTKNVTLSRKVECDEEAYCLTHCMEQKFSASE